MLYTLIRPPESIVPTVTVASPFPVGESCRRDVSVCWTIACCAGVVVTASAAVSVTIRLVVGVVSSVVVVAVASTLISCPLLVTDTIFQRIHFVLKCRYFFKNGS